ncbi:MAG: ribonuclease R [Candidatus Izemoplasmatales bacterium]|nr:ribonuclease R [Candidatus Izemoplasmatales bacterium]
MKQKIINLLKRKKDQPVGIKKMQKDLKFSDRNKLLMDLRSLIDDGTVVSVNDKYLLVEGENFIEGVLDLKTAGYGFLVREGIAEDVYIQRGKTLDAFSGDKVLVRVVNQSGYGKTEGEVVKVLKRALVKVVGEYYQGAIFPKSGTQNVFFKVTNKPKDLVDHQLVSAKIIRYGRQNVVDCEITEILGHRDDPGIDIIEVINRLGIPEVFPDEVITSLDEIPEMVADSEVVNRRDLRNELIFTIDGDDTKDIDDAISLEINPSGNFVLGVHIADVSHYVVEESPLDQEAFQRGTSVYLADKVIPMLPRKLSNGICSLNPGVDRLTISCVMEITKTAEVISYDIFPSVIRSHQQLTYGECNKILDGYVSEAITDSKIIENLKLMAKLAQILKEVRIRIGSIDFETIEPKISFDYEGNVTDIKIRDRGVSEKLIEEFMLVANQVVASDSNAREYPFIYRVHEKPDQEKLAALFQFAKELGVVTDIPKRPTHKHLQKLLLDVEESEYDKVFNTLMLRSMAKAKYFEHNLGHYGLAFTDYTHFTSPIRRYPDLLVHRMLRAYRFNTPTIDTLDHFHGVVPKAAIQSSLTERRAMLAEREVEDMKKAEFMESRLNQVFEGVISGLTRFGMFVELPNTIEGLVHISTFPEAIDFNEKQMIYLGISTRTVYNIGKKVQVRLVRADRQLGKIDFVLA